MEYYLGIETSCDDTSIGICDEKGRPLANIIFSQTKIHEKYGGVVPEIGARAHIEQIGLVFDEALAAANISAQKLKAIGVTFAPGLLGPLMVGVQFAKGLGASLKIPVIPIHHIEGHIFSGFGEDNFLKPPFLSLIISGGHTSLYLVNDYDDIKTIGETLDDAAGEALDKLGREIGFPYPCGQMIDELSKNGKPNFYRLPVALKNDESLNFSFSGLKTAGLKTISSSKDENNFVSNFCASLLFAISNALYIKTKKALSMYKNVNGLVLGGGVSANTVIRDEMLKLTKEYKKEIFLPPKILCTDNGLMIARACALKKIDKDKDFSKIDVLPSISIEKWLSLYSNL